jgi:hypothetical protein
MWDSRVCPTWNMRRQSCCVPQGTSEIGQAERKARARLRGESSGSPLSCPTLMPTISSLVGTPSRVAPRLKKAPAAADPLPQGGERQVCERHCQQLSRTGHQDATVPSRASTFDFSTCKNRTNEPGMSMKIKDRHGSTHSHDRVALIFGSAPPGSRRNKCRPKGRRYKTHRTNRECL